MRTSVKATKKVLAALACACLTLALLPVAALAQDSDELTTYASSGIADSGACGDDLTWTLTGTEEAGYTLSISGTGDMWDYPGEPSYPGSIATLAYAPDDQYYPPWTDYREYIDTVAIGIGVTSIGVSAFVDCLSLKQVSIPDTVTSTGFGSFAGCESLLTISIPDGMEIIGSFTFFDCTALEKVQLGRNVEVIEYNAFDDCSALTSITVPVSLKSVGRMAFDGCDALTDVYYAGTEEQWAAIDVASGNNSLLDATIHYNWVTETSEPKANPASQPPAPTLAAQSIRFAKGKVALQAGKKAAVKVKGAKTKLCVKVPKKAVKSIKVTAKGKKKVVVKAKTSAKSGTYKVKVWAKKGAGYAKSAKKTLKVRVK